MPANIPDAIVERFAASALAAAMPGGLHYDTTPATPAGTPWGYFTRVTGANRYTQSDVLTKDATYQVNLFAETTDELERLGDLWLRTFHPRVGPISTDEGNISAFLTQPLVHLGTDPDRIGIDAREVQYGHLSMRVLSTHTLASE